MKVDIGVGGRFHAERMSAAFAGAGHEVRFATSLPRSRLRHLCGAVECITSGVNGIRVPPGDAGAICRELLVLVDDPRRVDEMRAKAARGASRGWREYDADLLALAAAGGGRAWVGR